MGAIGRRSALAAAWVAVMVAGTARAEFRRIEQTVYGMD
ncbi:MAG: hypothetical protein KatS3mg102_2332 [Planctomycetota bacterium]|nr:MAG: hypothetical protein KatS3mg102_2332 [Planctomycetota bacterium]